MATTKAQAMIAWAQEWAAFFAPFVQDDNEWYWQGKSIDGKDAGDLGEGMAEVARLLQVAQDRITDLERDRALLLAYARARQHMVGGWTEDVSDEEFRRRGRACDEAWVALRDAGLLAGDDAAGDDGGGES